MSNICTLLNTIQYFYCYVIENGKLVTLEGIRVLHADLFIYIEAVCNRYHITIPIIITK